MRLGQAATVGALVSLALLLPACGGGSPPVSGGVEAAGAASAPRGTAGGSCGSQVRRFVASMDALRGDLAQGLSYDDYMSELRRVRDAYGRIRSERLPFGCLVATGAPAERALNRYIAAADAWGKCLATVACETASIESRLQGQWARASDLLSAAQDGL